MNSMNIIHSARNQFQVRGFSTSQLIGIAKIYIQSTEIGGAVAYARRETDSTRLHFSPKAHHRRGWRRTSCFMDEALRVSGCEQRTDLVQDRDSLPNMVDIKYHLNRECVQSCCRWMLRYEVNVVVCAERKAIARANSLSSTISTRRWPKLAPAPSAHCQQRRKLDFPQPE